MNHLLNAGPVSMIFLVILFIWITFFIRFFLCKKHHILVLFTFPIAFGLIAMTSWVSFLHSSYLEIEERGFPDPGQYTHDGLIFSRFCLICLATAWIALVTACLGFLRKNSQPSL